MLLVVDNEVDRRYGYLPDELRRYLPEHGVCNVAQGDSLPTANDLDAVVITGSTAGVYETESYPWMDDERAFVRHLVEEEVPTLGVCFGHQLVNDALGGRVEHRGLTAELVAVDFADDPLFDDVDDVVPMVHGDHVVAPGDGMRPIASAAYYPLLATRHETAPLWTTQYHPEFTARVHDRIAADFGWSETAHSFEDVAVERTFENFLRLAGL